MDGVGLCAHALPSEREECTPWEEDRGEGQKPVGLRRGHGPGAAAIQAGGSAGPGCLKNYTKFFTHRFFLPERASEGQMAGLDAAAGGSIRKLHAPLRVSLVGERALLQQLCQAESDLWRSILAEC